MKIFKDVEGRLIRLSDERRRHILEHPEMVDMISAIEETLVSPQKIIESLSDTHAHLFKLENHLLCRWSWPNG